MADTDINSNKQELEWLSDYLGVSCGKLSSDMKEHIPVLKTGNGTSIKGFITVAKYFVQSSGQKYLCGVGPAQKAAIDQWLEYRQNYVDRSIHDKDINSVLKEVNSYIANKVYLVGNKLSLADIFLYCGVYHIVKDLAFNEKQSVMHTCRWFDNVQHHISHPKYLSIVPFQKNTIYSDSGH